MIRCALVCNVKSDFKPVSIGAGDKFLKIVQRSQLWMNGGMAALFGADRPWAANIIRLRSDGIIFSFPECLPDRMNWREINDVETHGRDVGKRGFAIAAAAVPPGL